MRVRARTLACGLSVCSAVLCGSCVTEPDADQQNAADAASGARPAGQDAATGSGLHSETSSTAHNDAATDEDGVSVTLTSADEEAVTVVLTDPEGLEAGTSLASEPSTDSGPSRDPNIVEAGSSTPGEVDSSPPETTDPIGSTECEGDGCEALDAGSQVPRDAAPDAALEASLRDCETGESRPCADALGACALGAQVCDDLGTWGPCSIVPTQADTCAPEDDSNCNGTANEGCACVAGETSTCAAEFGAFGACAGLPVVCSGAGQWQGECQSTARDTCTPGNDNDCDGIPNEGCECVAGETSTCGAERGSLGACSGVALSCSSTGTWTGNCNATSAELCDTARVDEDCDGQVNEPEVCNRPPTISITAPSADAVEIYDGYDEARDQWYADVSLRATASDPEDGALSGASVQWFTNQTGVQEAGLGSGTAPTVRLYSNDCFGTTHVIRAQATDSNGASTSVTRSIFIYTLC